MINKKWKIGDEVIALTNPQDDSCQPRKKGKLYQVLDVLYCCKCGSQSINITTIPYNSNLYNNELECDCGSSQPSNNKSWTDSNLFIKPEEINETLELALNNEDYELSILLRDIKL